MRKILKIVSKGFSVMVLSFIVVSMFMMSLSRNNFTDGLEVLSNDIGTYTKDYKILGYTYDIAKKINTIDGNSSYNVEHTQYVYIIPAIASLLTVFLSGIYEIYKFKQSRF